MTSTPCSDQSAGSAAHRSAAPCQICYYHQYGSCLLSQVSLTTRSAVLFEDLLPNCQGSSAAVGGAACIKTAWSAPGGAARPVYSAFVIWPP